MTAGPVVETLMEDYDPNFVVVRYHVNSPGGGSDPYDTPWGNDRGASFYLIWSDGIPWFAYDGLFDAWPINTYETKLQQQLAVPTDVSMTVVGIEISADTYDITTEVCVDAGGVGKTMRIYTVQVLDHYPAAQPYYRNTFMQAASTEDVTVAAGECDQVVRSFTFDATSMAQIEDIKIVAWAQEPLDVFPADVHQAIESPWPFIDVAIFDDDFESGDLTSWSGSNP